jgi:cytochrome c-type biogenesis protein
MSEYDLTAWWAPFLAFAAGIVAVRLTVRVATRAGLPVFRHSRGRRTRIGAIAGAASEHPSDLRVFVAGFSVVFTSLGAFGGVFVPIVRSSIGQRVAGLVIVGVGAFLLLFAFRAGSASLYGEGRPLLGKVRPGGAAAFPLGMAFAAGWTPCIGPVLAATLALATAQSDPARSALLLFAFSMGLGVPFILLGLGVGGFMRRLGFLQRHYRAIAGVSGSMLVAIGLLLVSGAWVRVMSPLLRLVNSFEPPI